MLPKNRPPIHPGEVLKELFLDPAGITQAQLAAHLGWARTKVSQLVAGKRAITPETALALADVLGTSPDVWMDMQKDYDLWYALQDHRKKPLLLKKAS
jgi:addiction module HigA family antidote